MKVIFVTRKKRRGDVESRAQSEEIKRGSGERNGRRERRCQKRKVRGGGVSEDREDDKRAAEEADTWPVRRKLPSAVDSESAGYQSNPIAAIPAQTEISIVPFRISPFCSVMGEARIARRGKSK